MKIKKIGKIFKIRKMRQKNDVVGKFGSCLISEEMF